VEATGVEVMNGVSISTVVTIVFIVLKMTDYIDWSWWWIFSPTFIGIIFAVAMHWLFEITKSPWE
jgi:hypothetical protein